MSDDEKNLKSERRKCEPMSLELMPQRRWSTRPAVSTASGGSTSRMTARSDWQGRVRGHHQAGAGSGRSCSPKNMSDRTWVVGLSSVWQIAQPAGNRSENNDEASRGLKGCYRPLYSVVPLPSADSLCMARDGRHRNLRFRRHVPSWRPDERHRMALPQV